MSTGARVPDFTLARESFAAFAAMIGCPLTDRQAQSLALDKRTTAIVAPRQTGKSRALALLALHRGFRAPTTRVLVVSAGEEASRRLLAEVRQIATGSPLLSGSVVDENAGLLTLTNGSSIRSAPASERSIRGETADLLLIDEAALVSDDVALGAALPTTAARPDARVVMASSPWAEGGFFHAHVIAGPSEHVAVERWTLADAPWISDAAIESARASMSAARFEAEFGATWGASHDALFSRAVLERASADLTLPTFPPPPARVLAGADWGAVADRSAVAWIARAAGLSALNPGIDRDRPVFLACARAWAPGAPLSDVVDAVAAAPSHLTVLSSETNGIGQGPSQQLWRLVRERAPGDGGGVLVRHFEVSRAAERGRGRTRREAVTRRHGFATKLNAVTTSAASKSLGYERLRWLADRGQLVLERGSDLVRELAGLRLELRPGGAEKIEAGVGHDDLADSLYICGAPWRPRGGSLRYYLSELAERRTPEADVSPIDERVVETGEGLRLYARPPLQSVTGEELSLPEGARPARVHPSSTILAARAAVTEALRTRGETT